MDHLQAGIEFSFAVFPESAALFEPCEGSFDDPSLRHDLEGVELVAFGDLDRCAKLVRHRVGERFAGVAAIDQHALNRFQVVRAALEGGQGAVPVGHLGGGDSDCMRQALRIDRDVALDAGDLLARVIALLAGRIGVLHALRVDDQEAGRGAAPLFDAGLANRFFLAPAPAR